MNSTPLPEQGGFNERLDEILVRYRCGTINPDPKKWAMDDNDLGHARTAIRTLVLEEIIGEDEDPVYTSAGSITRKNIIEYQNKLRAEQRKKLGDTHDTK